jgi:hypothetical protein
MKFKNVFLLIFLFLLVGCAPATPAIPMATLTSEATLMPSPTKTATLIPSPTATFSPEQQIAAIVDESIAKYEVDKVIPKLNKEQMADFVDGLNEKAPAAPFYMKDGEDPNNILIYVPNPEALDLLPANERASLVQDKYLKTWYHANKSILGQAEFAKAITQENIIAVVGDEYKYEGEWHKITSNPFGWDNLSTDELKNNPDKIPSDLNSFEYYWQQMVLVGKRPKVIQATIDDWPTNLRAFMRIKESGNGGSIGEIVYIDAYPADVVHNGGTGKKIFIDGESFMDERFWIKGFIVPGCTYLMGIRKEGFGNGFRPEALGLLGNVKYHDEEGNGIDWLSGAKDSVFLGENSK